MQVDMRREPRKRSKRIYSISWKDQEGLTHSAQVLGTDESASGVGIRCPVDIPKGTIVYIQSEEEYPTGYSVIRHASARGTSYAIGLELDEETKKTRPQPSGESVDHYEFLQINPKAQAETIQRVYRFLAARYHPDNPDTGDPEKFLHLNQAYEILSDPERRAQYDAGLKAKPPEPNEAFGSIDFLDGVEGELNRRLAVLSLLYRRCRTNVGNPQVSLLDLERHMGFPREYLDFTIWYLRSKKFVKQEDNAELSLTCVGVDFVEENFDKLPLLSKLLCTSPPEPRPENAQQRPREITEMFRLLPGEPVEDTAEIS